MRDKELFHLEILLKIFEKDQETCAKVESAKEKVRCWNREEEIRVIDIDDMQTQNEVHFESFDDIGIASLPQSPQIHSLD